MNVQGIYPPEQIEEIFEEHWGERDQNAKLERMEARDLLRECLNKLAADGDGRQWKGGEFDKLCSNYTSMLTV